MVGAGGIEPPNGGIKIRCLTAWLRPNRLESAENLALFTARDDITVVIALRNA